MILRILLYLLQVLISGGSNAPSPKHDLRKQTSHKNFSMTNMNYNLILVVIIVFLTIMFMLICVYITGASMLESGQYYNNIDAII